MYDLCLQTIGRSTGQGLSVAICSQQTQKIIQEDDA